MNKQDSVFLLNDDKINEQNSIFLSNDDKINGQNSIFLLDDDKINRQNRVFLLNGDKINKLIYNHLFQNSMIDVIIEVPPLHNHRREENNSCVVFSIKNPNGKQEQTTKKYRQLIAYICLLLPSLLNNTAETEQIIIAKYIWK